MQIATQNRDPRRTTHSSDSACDNADADAFHVKSRFAARILLVFVFFLQAAFFAFVALHRFVDGDEGFYLLASRLVLMHKQPYLDFFFTQAPLLPYVYALWLKMAGVTWVAAKLFAALLTAALGTLLFDQVAHQTQRALAALVGVVLFASSTLIFGFFPVVKTYSLAGLLLFAAYVLVSRVTPASPPWTLGVAGLLFGLSASTRSYLVLLLPLLAWHIVRNAGPTRWRPSTLSFSGGVLVGLAPCLYLFLASPPAFLFNNLGYHALRSQGGLLGMWKEKFFALLVAFLGKTESNGLQMSTLVSVPPVLLSRMRRGREAARLAFHLALGIIIISLLPTPVHPQYFCLCLPFLLVSAVCAAADYLTGSQPATRSVATAAACVLAIIYVGSAFSDFRRYLYTGQDVAGVEPGLAEDYRLQQVLAVSKAVDQVATPGESVASVWPGYIFQTHAVPFAGLESDFGLPIADQLTPEKRADYHLLTAADVEAAFAAHNPRVVVLRAHVSTPTNVVFRQKVREMEDLFRASLQKNGYSRPQTVGDISIYRYSPAY